jgi:hypothetical protein
MEKKKTWLIAGLAIFVTGGIATWWFYLPIHTIQSVVKKPLLDPDSAQFSDVTFNRSTGFGCGFVNAKNKMGGYVGRKQFVASLDGKVVMEPTEEKPPAPRERREELPTFSLNFSMEASLADSQRRLQESYDRLQESQRWSAEMNRIRAESEAFKALVASKCA